MLKSFRKLLLVGIVFAASLTPATGQKAFHCPGVNFCALGCPQGWTCDYLSCWCVECPAGYCGGDS
ncbi:MAG TPA: hypothetical protein VEL74_13630 [Thermoanaerobaculia bacterium]|nr:hypothetical protein [Thermoanaerobaculia bacterium]